MRLRVSYKMALVILASQTQWRVTLEPVWSWEKCVKPIVKTNSYQAPLTQYVVSGRVKVVVDDGIKEEYGPGMRL